ncbi:MAG: FAD-dependent oxidoreductase [Nitrospirae bacterium]|nr:FAD-dependent oxidoreductase [Nitrospirota bacterium]
MADKRRDVLVLGGGLTGLSAGYVLTTAGFKVKVFEGAAAVGGLSKTIEREGFRFDLGGHRFFTKNGKTDAFVKDLMGDELVSVPRKSKIYMRGRYFDYPLKPLNALSGLGAATTIKIVCDYGVERLKRLFKETENVSLEDWVVGNFGRKMFDIYFREYSEKVWGIECSRISADWVAQRIRGLSLAKAVKNAFFRLNGKDLPTLVDRFLYPELGIGRISDRLREEIEKGNDVFTGARVERVFHAGSRIEGVEVNSGGSRQVFGGEEFISSIPITSLVYKLDPPAPEKARDAAAKLKFRDLVIVSVMVKRRRVTDQTWIYIPEKKIPFGRIHEPANWSAKMAPEGRTLLVTEFFSFRGDRIWNETDGRLIGITVDSLAALGFVKKEEIAGGVVLRVPGAYPLFEVGYKEPCGELYEYLRGFKNLHIAGRGGMFRYYNMDHAIESGIATAERIIKRPGARPGREDDAVSATPDRGDKG